MIKPYTEDDVTSYIDWINKRTCEWTLENDEWGTWDTECGHTQYFSHGGVKDNGYEFCPYCGKLIKIIQEEK